MPLSPVQTVWITAWVVSELKHNTCLQPWDLSSSSLSSSSPLSPRCSLSSLVSNPSSSSSPSPPRTAVHVHLAHDTGDSQDIPPLSPGVFFNPQSTQIFTGLVSKTWRIFFCAQISTLPTDFTSFQRASPFTWFSSLSWKEWDISFLVFCLNIFCLQIKQISAALLSSLFQSRSLSLCGKIPQLWSAGFQNAVLTLSSSEPPSNRSSPPRASPLTENTAGEAGSSKLSKWGSFPLLNQMICPVGGEWYIPVRPLFHSEAEGGSQKTNTEGGGGGAGLLGLHIL